MHAQKALTAWHCHVTRIGLILPRWPTRERVLEEKAESGYDSKASGSGRSEKYKRTVRAGWSASCQSKQLFRQRCPSSEYIDAMVQVGRLIMPLFYAYLTKCFLLWVTMEPSKSSGIHRENRQLSWSCNFQTYCVATSVEAAHPLHLTSYCPG